MSKNKSGEDDSNGIKLHKQNEIYDEDSDPINAYFKKRYNRNSTNSSLKCRESNSDSSLGILDIDNMSLLDDMNNGDNVDTRLLQDLNLLNRRSGSTVQDQGSLEAANKCSSATDAPDAELEMRKHREMAQSNLMQLNSRLEKCIKNLKFIYNRTPDPVKSQPERENKDQHFPYEGKVKNWLDLNQSPQTPKYFVDELNSITDSKVESPASRIAELKSNFNILQKSNNEFNEMKTEPVIDLPENTSPSDDFTFASQNPDDILNRLEEDERKFIKDQSALSNNSQISHFSGLTGEEKFQQWHSASASGVGPNENERISIGKYFELRSHDIDSLIGSKNSKETATEKIRNSKSPTVIPPSKVDIVSNNEDEISVPAEEPYYNKTSSKRWHSSWELQRLSDTDSPRRHSNESFESANTLLIQNLIRGMDSGLSGTQINDRLLEYLGKATTNNGNAVENMETPKSSRTGVRIGSMRNSVKGNIDSPSSRDSLRKQFRSPLAGKKSISMSCTQVSSAAFDQNTPRSTRPRPKSDKNILSMKSDHIKGKPFDSSTPKIEHIKSGTQKFASDCCKLLINDGDWEPPHVSSLRKPKRLNESESAEENEKTIVLSTTVSSSDVDKKDSTIVPKDSLVLEDTIAAGDLTFVCERIKELQQDNIEGSCEEHDVLAIIRELANYPKGSVDCSALTPLLRDKFPELLSTFSVRANHTRSTEDSELGVKMHDSVLSSPGSWVKFLTQFGRKDYISIPVDVKKIIPIPVRNVTKDWLILSLEYMSIQITSDVTSKEKYINATKKNDEFHVGDFLLVSMKDILIPPSETSSFKIHLTPKVPVTLPIRLKCSLKKLISKEIRTQDLLLRVLCIFPKNNVLVKPQNEINFGVIPEECCEERIVQIAFDGACDLPLKVFIDKSSNFILSPEVTLDGKGIKTATWKEGAFFYSLKEGVKSVLQFKLKFRPRVSFNNTKNSRTNLRGLLLICLDTPSDNCILHQLQLSGSVAFTKFLCNPCSPLIFRATEIGQSVKREFPLKNMGAIDLEFDVSVGLDNSDESQTDDLFIAPKNIKIPQGEVGSIEVAFSGKTKESYVRRFLIFQLKPNGQVFYDIELIGIVMPVLGGKSVSRESCNSGPTHSTQNPVNVPFNLKSTTQALSWAAIPLDVEMKQTFLVMNTSSCNAMARFSFRKETSAFRFLNDNNEAIEKLRKVLKPNCSNVMTVIFRPGSIGAHINSIIIETNHLSGRKMISLNGYGGSPKIFIRNLKSDLNGSKIIRLVNSEPENQIFHATLEFINKGNIAGYVSIKTSFMVLSLCNELKIEPSNFVLLPNSRIMIRISQKLRNDDIKRLLSGRDICKLATITVTTGDEASRLRLRKLASNQRANVSQSIKFLLNEFINEKYEDFGKFDDDMNFENVFRKNLETVEIAAIVERPTDECESTILEVSEETVKEFVTILPAADLSIASLREGEKFNSSSRKNLEKSNLSASSGGSVNSRDKKITNWLATLEKP